MGKTVVVIDDSAYQRKFISDILTEAGFKVIGEAKNGEDAIDVVMDLNPMLVTIDHIMPKMTGIEAVEALREENCKSKILMVSSVAQDAVITEALSKGADKFLKKPFSNEDLINELSSM